LSKTKNPSTPVKPALFFDGIMLIYVPVSCDRSDMLSVVAACPAG
jgi:hypothetical protein